MRALITRFLLLAAIASTWACGGTTPSGSQDDAGSPGNGGQDGGGQTGATCGNGVLESGEQCDDGNTSNLDGCDSTCKFEQNQRATDIQVQAAGTPSCPNAFGAAFASALQNLQGTIDTSIANGQISILLRYLNLHDLSGASEASFEVGVLNGSPATGPSYNGHSDVDWWYTTAASSIDANRLPIHRLPASISGGKLSAGPGSAVLNMALGGVPMPLLMSSARFTLQNGAATSVTLSANGQTPGHLASEHLAPGLASFQSATQGELCGDLVASSLTLAAIPSPLVSVPTACAEGYTASNSVLDVLIGGCTIFGGQAVVPTQPDQSDPAAPVAGAGGPYTLTANATSKAVSTCKDKNGTTVGLAACLNAAAYSSYFKFATDRVVIR